MKKKIKTKFHLFFICLTMIFFINGCRNLDDLPAEEEPKLYTSGDFTYKLDQENAFFTQYEGTAAELTVPQTIDGYPVTGIEAECFSGNTSLVSVILPDILSTIGASAFSGCEALVSLTLEAAVPPTLGADAFKDCGALKNIYISDGCYDTYITAEGWSAYKDSIVVKEGTITFKAPGEGISGTMEGLIIQGRTSASLTACGFSRSGYTFAGWGISEDSADILYTDKAEYSMITGSVTLYAKWTPSAYTVAFDSNGGSAVASITSGYKTTVTKPSDPVKNGYNFSGWYKDKEFQSAWDFSSDTVPADGLTLYAKWTAINYSISYHLDNGTNNSSNPSTYTIETETISLTDPAKTGYSFLGWYEAENFSGTAVTEIAQGSTENKVFYAKWIIDQGVTVTIKTLSPDNGSITFSDTIEVAKGESLTVSITENYSEYFWLLDGMFIPGESAKILILDTTDITLGIHELTLLVEDNEGTTYSASVRITVTD